MLFTYFRVSYNIVKFQTFGSLHSWVIATLRFLLNTKSFITWKVLHLEHFVKICYSATFSIATTWWVTWVSISIAKWVIAAFGLSVTSIMNKITCNLKTIAFREFCGNMLFSYFWVSYNIAKFQTCSSWHSWVIATFRLLLLSKSLTTWKVLHVEYLVSYVIHLF